MRLHGAIAAMPVDPTTWDLQFLDHNLDCNDFNFNNKNVNYGFSYPSPNRESYERQGGVSSLCHCKQPKDGHNSCDDALLHFLLKLPSVFLGMPFLCTTRGGG